MKGLVPGGIVAMFMAGCTIPAAAVRPAAIQAPLPLAIHAHIADGCADGGDPAADCSEAAHWDLAAVGASSGAEAGPGAPVVVATIDTGMDPNHPDLAGVLLPQIDLVGEDLYRGASGPPISFAGRDGNGHGTHVAGTIAATAGREGVRILPVKAIGNTGTGDDEVISRAIRAAVDWSDPADPARRVRALNLSIGGRTVSRELGDAVRYAAARGVAIVASSGNRGRGVDFPATLPEAIAVGATNTADELADYSNRGPEVAIVAPGGDGSRGVYSTWPTYLTAADLRRGVSVPHDHAWMVGTSMAAPHVTAAVAVLLRKQPWLAPSQVRDRLAAAAVDLGPAGPDQYFGAGLLAVDRAVAAWGRDGL